MRIVTLLPSATEIVTALGALDALVAVSHACDYPSQVLALPRVTRSAVDDAAPPATVDRAVRHVRASGAPLYALDEMRIAELKPDIIVTQALCEVCAVSENEVRELAARLVPSPLLVTLSGGTIDGVLADIRRVAEAIDATDEAEELIDGFLARSRHVHNRLAAAGAPRPRVAAIEWTEPAFAAGHWVPEMIRRAGGSDVLTEPGHPSRAVDPAAVEAAAPDLLLIAPCGYDLRRSATEARRALQMDAWSWARHLSVWALDANALVSRPGPRLVDGIETIAEILHPDLFPHMLPGKALRVEAPSHAGPVRVH